MPTVDSTGTTPTVHLSAVDLYKFDKLSKKNEEDVKRNENIKQFLILGTCLADAVSLVCLPPEKGFLLAAGLTAGSIVAIKILDENTKGIVVNVEW